MSAYRESKPRLYATLSSTRTSIERKEDNSIVFHFEVAAHNIKEWIRTKMLDEMVHAFRQSLGYFSVSFEIEVAEVEQKEVHYMPADQAKVMASRNENVMNAIKELELTV